MCYNCGNLHVGNAQYSRCSRQEEPAPMISMADSSGQTFLDGEWIENTDAVHKLILQRDKAYQQGWNVGYASGYMDGQESL